MLTKKMLTFQLSSRHAAIQLTNKKTEANVSKPKIILKNGIHGLLLLNSFLKKEHIMLKTTVLSHLLF